MWQSQAFGGAFSFGGSVPDDQGTTWSVCAVEMWAPSAVMFVFPATGSLAGKPDQTRSVRERLQVRGRGPHRRALLLDARNVRPESVSINATKRH
jgi:hypothetical protein